MVHSAGYVHCDVKPQNILFNSADIYKGIQRANDGLDEFVLIDFGISMKYLDHNGSHVAKHRLTKFRGSYEFTAIDCLEMYRKSSAGPSHDLPADPTRKHDIESLLYTIIHLLQSKRSIWGDKSFRLSKSLTLSQKKSEQRRKLMLLGLRKDSMDSAEVCAGLPNAAELTVLYDAVMSIGYEEKPDYDHLFQL